MKQGSGPGSDRLTLISDSDRLQLSADNVDAQLHSMDHSFFLSGLAQAAPVRSCRARYWNPLGQPRNKRVLGGTKDCSIERRCATQRGSPGDGSAVRVGWPVVGNSRPKVVIELVAKITGTIPPF